MTRSSIITAPVALLAAIFGLGLATSSSSSSSPLVVLESREVWPSGARPRVPAAGERAAISLKGMVNGAQVRPVEIDGAYRALATAEDAIVSDLTVDGLEASVLRECLSIQGTNIVIRNVRCRMQGGPQPSMHDLPEGIHIKGGSNIRIENSQFDGFQTTLAAAQYWNGDGVAAERGVNGLTLINVTADNNTDAGFDLKPPVVMDNVSASGNCRNYRLWADARIGTMRIGNVVKRGGIAGCAGIWVNGSKDGAGPTIHIANLIVNSSTPMDIIRIDHGNANIRMDRCSITAPAGTRRSRRAGTATSRPTGAAGYAPRAGALVPVPVAE